jgi:curved DNA-binding protein CbpA
MPLHTHYDNLKVARNAPPEVIKAAYRTLSQKYHPDRRPNDPEAARIMSILNGSFDVLSDPARKREHDEWIAQQEVLEERKHRGATATPAPPQSEPPRPPPTEQTPAKGSLGQHLGRNWVIYASVFGVCGLAVSQWDPQPKTAETAATGRANAQSGGGEGAVPAGQGSAPAFASVEERLAFVRNMGATSEALKAQMVDDGSRRDFVEKLFYESRRAGVDSSLLLGLVETASGFRKYAISKAGARGFTQVTPEWTSRVGDGNVDMLFQTQSNLFYGSVLLRGFLDEENGDIARALKRYEREVMRPGDRKAGSDRFVAQVRSAQQRWESVQVAQAQATADPSRSAAAAKTGSVAPSMARCAGNPDRARCEELERRLANESPREANARRGALEQARADAMRAVAGLERQNSPATPFAGARPTPEGSAGRAQSTATCALQANGQAWPSSASALASRDGAGGRSSITIDNARNDAPVHGKLFGHDGQKAVREFYIPAFGSFTAQRVPAGSYDIRYRDLSDCRLARSDPFTIDEQRTSEGVRFSNMTMTLYKVRNGNMRTHSLSEGEF